MNRYTVERAKTHDKKLFWCVLDNATGKLYPFGDNYTVATHIAEDCNSGKTKITAFLPAPYLALVT